MDARTASVIGALAAGRRVAILFGAGAGVPAGVPAAADLISGIADALVVDRTWAQKVAALSQPHGPMRFETAMEWLHETADPDLDVLAFLDEAQPGPLHYALAAAGIAGARLLTTNFDDLAEQAIEALGAAALSVEADGAGREPASASTAVIKLHGTRLVHEGGAVRRSRFPLQATIASIVRGGGGAGLTQPTGELLMREVADSHLLVVGYSGSDDLDVMPSLHQCRPRHATWVHYARQEPSVVDDLDGLTEGARELLEAWQGAGVSVAVIVGDAMAVMRSAGWYPPPALAAPPTALDWRGYLHRWASQAHHHDPVGLGWVACVMGSVSRDDEKARAVAESVASEDPAALWNVPRRLYELAQSAYHTDEPADVVIEFADQATAAAIEYGDLREAANSAIMTARALSGERRYAEARVALDRARELLDRAPDPNDYTKAYLAHWTARLRLLEGDSDGAREHAEEAIDLYGKHGNFYEVCESLQVAGQAAWLDGDVEEAERYLERAVRMARLGPYFDQLVAALMRRASVAYDAGDVMRSYDYARESAIVALDHGLTSEVAESLTPWGTASNELGAFAEARDAFEQALEFITPFEDNAWRPDIVLGLADSLLHLGHPEEALAVLERETSTIARSPWDEAHAAGIRYAAGQLTGEKAGAALAAAIDASPGAPARAALCLVRLGIPGPAGEQLREYTEGAVASGSDPERLVRMRSRGG